MHGMEEAIVVEEPAEDGEGGKAKAKKGPKKISGGKDYSYYKLTVTDNGCGMKHEEIPKMFGTVLSGTKYGVRQERGKFGLGSKMVLIWSKMSTGLPMTIRSSQGSGKQISLVQLDLDIHSNAPNVHKHEKLPNDHKWRGSQVGVTIGGEFSIYKRYTVNYLREMAVITPYARFEMIFKAEDPSKSFHILHSRRSEIMPPPPSKAKVHPSSIDNHTMENLLHGTGEKTLLRFLTRELDCVNGDLARELIKGFGASFREEMSPSDIDTSMIRQMVDKMNQMSFAPPSGAVLAPAGEYNLHLGVMKEMKPDMIATSTQDVRVVDGHAVIVEAAVSLGGRRQGDGITVHRFANRIPMLFQPGSDLTVKTCNSAPPQGVNWKSYKIDKNSHKVGVYVSICSTKIPYGGPNKEYIGDAHEDLKRSVRGAIMSCCVQLKARLARREALKLQKERRKNLQKYIPFVTKSLSGILETMVTDGCAEAVKDDAGVLLAVRGFEDKSISDSTLQHKLRNFVEEADMEQAMAAAQHGDKDTVAREDLCLRVLGNNRRLTRPMHSTVGVWKLFEDA
uniref:DNA topoisomerase 6 subunit B n=1 Tax=Hemiselmis andersenii TaxID=464988 RepID=A0A7S1EK14_HEMAN